MIRSAKGMNGITGFVKHCWQTFRGWIHRIYDGLLHMDIQEKTNKNIFRIVILNFIVLVIITCFWFFGIFALIIYSVLLFLFLRKYFRDIQNKYQLLISRIDQSVGGREFRRADRRRSRESLIR